MKDFTKKGLDVGTTVAVMSNDHSFELRTLIKSKAVLNTGTNDWFQYVGDEYLEEGDEVHLIWVAD